MSLRAQAKRLAQPFVGLCARFRKKLDSLRNIERNINPAKTRSPAEIHSTAIHEAGHAALMIALGFGCEAVTIIPDLRKGSVGLSIDGGLDGRTQDLSETDVATAELHTFAPEACSYLRRAMVFYAGAEAVRQLIPTNPHPEAGAWSDKERAIKLISNIASDAESAYVMLSFARRRCRLLVAHYRPQIQALAHALEARLTLSGEAPHTVFMRSLRERPGRPFSPPHVRTVPHQSRGRPVMPQVIRLWRPRLFDIGYRPARHVRGVAVYRCHATAELRAAAGRPSIRWSRTTARCYRMAGAMARSCRLNAARSSQQMIGAFIRRY